MQVEISHFKDKFSYRLKILRENLADLSQRAFAERVGVSSPTASAWESDEKAATPDRKKWPTIAQALGISESFLILGVPVNARDWHAIGELGISSAEFVQDDALHGEDSEEDVLTVSEMSDSFHPRLRSPVQGSKTPDRETIVEYTRTLLQATIGTPGAWEMIWKTLTEDLDPERIGSWKTPEEATARLRNWLEARRDAELQRQMESLEKAEARQP